MDLNSVTFQINLVSNNKLYRLIILISLMFDTPIIYIYLPSSGYFDLEQVKISIIFNVNKKTNI